MTILGIDPGTRRVGYGAITYDKKTFTLIDAGLLPVTSSNNIEALAEIRGELKKLIQKIRPDALAIEKLYFSKKGFAVILTSAKRRLIWLFLALTRISFIKTEPTPLPIPSW